MVVTELGKPTDSADYAKSIKRVLSSVKQSKIIFTIVCGVALR